MRWRFEGSIERPASLKYSSYAIEPKNVNISSMLKSGLLSLSPVTAHSWLLRQKSKRAERESRLRLSITCFAMHLIGEFDLYRSNKRRCCLGIEKTPQTTMLGHKQSLCYISNSRALIYLFLHSIYRLCMSQSSWWLKTDLK